MGTKKVSITLSRTYYKTATIEVEVDENLKDDELRDFLIEDEKIDSLLENELSEQSLYGGDDEWEYSDPTNNDGGHL